MNKDSYLKDHLSYQQQLEQLKKRGLNIKNEARALHLLEYISYYRLSGYWYPLLSNKQEHIFKKDVNFETAFKLYCFDRELRQLVLAEIEKIEIAIRAKLTFIMSEKFGPFWFKDSSLFKNKRKHRALLKIFKRDYEKSDEEFINAFSRKYSNPIPPSWMIMEITSFGTISIMYKNIKPSKEKRKIAHHFGLADTIFSKWVHSLVYLRNVCAHHTRLWNRSISIRPIRPRNTHYQWLNNTNIPNNKTYYINSVLNVLNKGEKSLYQIT